jgi:hypothetical protein
MSSVAIIIASIATLTLEIAQVRIFSYSLDPLLVFGAISVAMLGMGAGGIAIALRPVEERDVQRRLGSSLAMMGLSTIVAHALFARTSDWIGFGARAGVVLTALPILGLLVIPYFFGGAVVAIAMTRGSKNIGDLYLANMLGSGAGALLVHPILGPLGAEGIVALSAVMVACGAVYVDKRRATIAIAVICALAAPFARQLYAFRPDPGDLYGVARAALAKLHPEKNPDEYTPTREYSRWDPVGRVEVWGFPGELGTARAGDEVTSMKLFAQDGGAGSMLLMLHDRGTIKRALFDGTVYGGAYFLRSPKRALIVGLGGSPDIQAAEYHGVPDVTGVEINGSAIELVRDAYASFLQYPYTRPGVKIEHHDGRGFVERVTARYDLVQITGADTYAAGSTGAFMFSESYLYTEEGFRRWISALSDDGVLSVIRFGLEPLRVVTTELSVLRSLGFQHPEQHLVILRQGIWVNVLCTRRPIDREDLGRLARALHHASELPRMNIPVYDALGFGLGSAIEVLYAPGVPSKPPYSDLLRNDAAWLAAAPLDFAPVPDDRPFFFQFLGAKHLSRVISAPADDWYARGLRAHATFVIAIVILSIGLLLLPAARKKGGRDAVRPLSFFIVVGLAYLAVEMGWMQRTGLFLGHPTHAVVVTLVTLLLGSGLGSAWAARRKIEPDRLARGAAVAVVAMLGLAEIALPKLFAVMLPLSLSLRVGALVLVTAPLGFAMGIPFPSGLRLVKNETLVAWGLAANAFASIVASLLAVPFAIFAGFRVLGLIALALYALSALLVPTRAATT